MKTKSTKIIGRLMFLFGVMLAIALIAPINTFSQTGKPVCK
jgi:hypothetical protein